MAETSPSPAFDVAVVGAGLAGLAAALCFARAGFRVASVGRIERPGPGRTVALLGQTLEFLQNLGVLAAVEGAAAPMRKLRIVDDTGSLLAARPVEFRATEIGRDLFGWNIENAAFAAILLAALGPRFEADVAGFDFADADARLTLDDGRVVTAALVVGADGRGSPARKAAGIDMSARRFGQTALTMSLRHSRPHDDFSTEFHTRQGPFTLVPLPPDSAGRRRSSLVWVMAEAEARRRAALADDALSAEIEAQAQSIHGAMLIAGARGVFPLASQSAARLTAKRLALIGDAAHVLPPIGAQGFNLGLRDVAQLIEIVAQAKVAGEDF